MSQRKKSLSSRNRARLRFEELEVRCVPSVNVVESFENPYALGSYRSLFHNVPAADIAPAAAHNGSPGLGLVKDDGYEWLARNDATVAFGPGRTLSAWAQFADAADGRLYLGFGTNPQSATQDTSAFRSYALVLAANTNELLLQNVSGSNFANIGSGTSQTYQANHWYRLEVQWGSGGALTGRLYDSDGTTLLNSISGTNTAIAAGGIAFRGFGSPKYFDTIVQDTDSGASVAERAAAGGALPDGWSPGVAPPARVNGPSDANAPVPWQYRNAIGTGRDILLSAFNQLQQYARVGDVVALAGANTSFNNGTVGTDWGPAFGGPATPILAQYVFRLLPGPGETTQLIGSSDVKHFFAPSILNPGISDTYDSSLNATQSLMSPGSELDPMTGVLHRASHQGPQNVNGFNTTVSHGHTPLEHRLTVAISDLDPNQNPAGTRWFLMGNAYVEGDTNVANNSRWVEIRPNWNGTTFSFTYPNGSAGQLNFRTIPGLQEPAAPVRVIDNDQAGFSLQGSGWQPYSAPGYGFNNTSYWIDNGTANDTASWTFTGLTPGRYRVSVTYPPDAYYGTVQYYTISSGGTVLATVPINPQATPPDFADLGVFWKNLGSGLYNLTGTSLTVTLSGLGTGSVVADAVRIERVGPEGAAIVDDSDGAAFSVTGDGWQPYSSPGYGYQDGVQYTAASGDNTARWIVTGLLAGEYRVSVTWTAYSGYATNARFTVLDGGTERGSFEVNQRDESPSDFTDAGVGWRYLGGASTTFTVTSGALVIELSGALADGGIEADAIRFERVS